MSKYSRSTVGIVGGRPVIAGTRIPISLLLIRLKQGYSLKELHIHWPYVTIKTFENVLSELSKTIDTKKYGGKVPQV